MKIKTLSLHHSFSFPRPKAGHVDSPDFEVDGFTMEGGESRPQVGFCLISFRLHTGVHACAHTDFAELVYSCSDKVQQRRRGSKLPHAGSTCSFFRLTYNIEGTT